MSHPVLFLIFILFIGSVYFLPSIIGRNKEASGYILFANIFLAWTAIGWVIILIWALSPDKEQIIFYNDDPNQFSARTDELIKLKQLLDSGAITQTEYDKEKARILNR